MASQNVTLIEVGQPTWPRFDDLPQRKETLLVQGDLEKAAAKRRTVGNQI